MAAAGELWWPSAGRFVSVYGEDLMAADTLRVDAAFWRDAISGPDVEVDDILRSFRSITDWPAALLWRRLVAQFPDARVVLTVRDPNAWYDSMIQALDRCSPRDAGATSQRSLRRARSGTGS
jgi:hypothetical protein